MPTKNDSESMWLEYIMKLNDRELNRRRASGITLWALFGLLGVLFYKISDALPTVFSQNNTFLVLIIITNFFNIAFLFSHIFVILYVNIIESEGRRLTSKLSQKSNIILVWTITLLKILGGVSNIYIGIKAPSINIETWPYYSFGIYLILDVFFPWGKYLYLQIKYRKKSIEYPEVPQAIFIEPLGKKYVCISLSLVCIGLLYVIVYSIRSLIINQHIIQNINLIKASFEITVIWIILLLFSYKLGIRIKHNWLENLERKILVEELKSDQIRSLFVKEYLGYPMLEWINSMQNEIDIKYKKFREVIDKSETELEGIKDIDTKYKYEVKGRKEEIMGKVKEAHKEFLKFQEEKMEQIVYIKKKAGTTKEEESLLTIIYHEWQTQLVEIKKNLEPFIEKYKLT